MTPQHFPCLLPFCRPGALAGQDPGRPGARHHPEAAAGAQGSRQVGICVGAVIGGEEKRERKGCFDDWRDGEGEGRGRGETIT